MGITTSQTTLVNSSLALASQIQLLGRDIYNKAGVLVGTIVTLQSGLTNTTAFAQAPDLDDNAAKLNSLLARAQRLVNDIDQIKTDLTIPT
jgi:hypothetical protein